MLKILFVVVICASLVGCALTWLYKSSNESKKKLFLSISFAILCLVVASLLLFSAVVLF